jgi:hypothetical protein
MMCQPMLRVPIATKPIVQSRSARECVTARVTRNEHRGSARAACLTVALRRASTDREWA